MNSMPMRAARWATLLAGLTLIVSAAAVQAQDDALPAVAVEVSGLASGDVVTDNELSFSVEPVGFEFSAAHVGTPPVDGLGHYHVVLDGGLIDMFAASDASVSLQNVTPGTHTLMVVPALNNHMPVPKGAVPIKFDYQPAEALADITEVETSGEAPTVTIESPANGDTVSGPFDITISTTDFTLSEDLFGKPNVAGAGHWHVFIDAAEGMGTMAGMAGGDTFTVDPSALTPGPHTFIAVLVDNLHAPFDPPIATKVDLEVAAASDGDSGSTDATGSEVVVSLTEFSIDPADIELEAGSFTFVGANDGAVPHALAIEGEGVSAATPDTSYSVGESEQFTVDLAAGTYELFCPIPGHREAGMVATVTVAG